MEEESLEDSELDGDNDTSMFDESMNPYVDDLESSVQDNSSSNDAPWTFCTHITSPFFNFHIIILNLNELKDQNNDIL